MEELKPSEITKAIEVVGKTFSPKAFLFLMEKFELKIAELQAEAKPVTDSDSEAASIELAITSKSINKVIDKARMSAKRPYLDFGKELDSYVRPSQKSLTVIEDGERKKCMEYRDRLLRAKEAADALAAKKAEEAAKEEVTETEHALNRLKAPTGMAPERVAPKKMVESYAGGSGSYRTVKVPKLVDITKVPAQYLLVDWKKVNADIKDGILTIPGIEIKDQNKLTLTKG